MKNSKWQYKNLSWKVDLETILTPVYSSSRKLKKQAAAHRAVLAFFGHVCRADGTLWYSYDSICKHTNLGRATVSRVLKNFKTVGLLDWHTVTGNAHKKGHNIYTLSLSALQSAPKIDGAEFPSGTEQQEFAEFPNQVAEFPNESLSSQTGVAEFPSGTVTSKEPVIDRTGNREPVAAANFFQKDKSHHSNLPKATPKDAEFPIETQRAEFPSGTERTLYVPEPLRGLTPEQIRLKYEYATAHGGCSEVEYRMLADAVRQIEGAE